MPPAPRRGAMHSYKFERGARRPERESPTMPVPGLVRWPDMTPRGGVFKCASRFAGQETKW